MDQRFIHHKMKLDGYSVIQNVMMIGREAFPARKKEKEVKQKKLTRETAGEDEVAVCCLPFKISSNEIVRNTGESVFEKSKSQYEDNDPIDAELGLTEDHFACPKSHFGFSAAEELEMAIEHCKNMIMESTENSSKRKKLVMKLCQLRFKLQEIKDGQPEFLPCVEKVLGHKFEYKSLERPQQYCEKCCKIIWGVLHGWYSCRDCGFKCHSKCLNLISRTCAQVKVIENSTFIQNICPEIGLSAQDYRCAECRRKIMFKDGYSSLRRCDYSGYYYCSFCHWNSLAVIPARVIHNWDFEPRKVCRASLQFLRLMMRKPVLNLQSLNPMLFSFVVELSIVKRLREEILIMKQYFMTCQVAKQNRLLMELKERQHFVENTDMYSLQDLIDLESGLLMEYIENVHSLFVQHITQECQGCLGKGFFCELCKNEDILFPFDRHTSSCNQCLSVFHQECWIRKGSCPRCERRSKLCTFHI